MNTFNVNKRCISTYEQFLKNRKKAEEADHDEKGEHSLVKQAMAGEKEGKKGIATLAESVKHIILFEEFETITLPKIEVNRKDDHEKSDELEK